MLMPGYRQPFPCGCVARVEGDVIEILRCHMHEAAPTLFQACREWAEQGWCVQGPRASDSCGCDWHMAKAAVAKAEGKKS